MNVSEAGVEFLAQWEGFSPVPYNDPSGNCTVGFGELLHLGSCTTGELATPPITEQEGYAALRRKIQPYAVAVEGMSRPLNQNEFDAMVSLCYNIGPGGYLNSAVRTAVNQYADPCPALNQIIHGTDGVAYPGLVRRRQAECDLFSAPVTEEHMASTEYTELKTADQDIERVIAITDKKASDFGNLLALTLPLIANGDTARLKEILAYLAAVPSP